MLCANQLQLLLRSSPDHLAVSREYGTLATVTPSHPTRVPDWDLTVGIGLSLSGRPARHGEVFPFGGKKVN